MADHTITAANVVGSGVGTLYTAGAEITAGQFVYLDAADSNKAKLCDNSTAVKAACAGMALNHAYSGQPVQVLRSGDVTISTQTGKKGDQMVAGNTAGKGMDVGDLGTGDYVTWLGYFKDATTFSINIVQTGLLNISL